MEGTATQSEMNEYMFIRNKNKQTNKQKWHVLKDNIMPGSLLSINSIKAEICLHSPGNGVHRGCGCVNVKRQNEVMSLIYQFTFQPSSMATGSE